jgi:hypothetical protein
VATTPSLRPLGVGEILDAGIKIYLRHWRPFMLCVVGIVLPVEILSVLVVASIDPDVLRNAFSTSSSSTSSVAESTQLAASGVIDVVAVLSQLLVTAALFKGVCDAWLGATPSATRSLRFGARRLVPLLGLAICGGVVVAIGIVLLVIPGIWIGVCFSLSIPAFLFERAGPIKSLGRSYSLVKGRWWPIFGTLIVGSLMVLILGAIIQGVPTAIARSIASDSTPVLAIAAIVGRTVSSVLTMPFTAAVIALLYFDQRVRKEGFDLQLMAEGLGTIRDPDAPLPPPLVGPQYTEAQRAAAPYWPPPAGWVPPPAAEAPAADREWWQDPLPDEAGSYGGYGSPRADPDWQRDASGRPMYPGAAPEGPSDREVLRAPWQPASRPPAPDPGSPPADDAAREAGSPPADDAARTADDAARTAGDSPRAAGSPPADDSPRQAGSPPADDLTGRPGAPPADAAAREAGSPPADAAAREAGSPPADAAAPPARDRPESDGKRADWLPPEAPRGPGGL